MDTAVVGLMGLLIAVLLGAGTLDAVRSVRRRRRLAPAPPVMAPGPNRIVLVRHGQTEWSESGRHTGWTDVPLTEAGRVQARQVRDLLDGWRFDAVLVSPLSRARETCELLARPEPVTVAEDLREWNYGDDEGRTSEEIRADRPGWTVWGEGPAGGETIEQVAERARRVLGTAAGDVLVVAHGHVLRVLATCWLGLEPRAGRLLGLDPATVSVLDHEREQPVIREWNVRRIAPTGGGR